MWVARVLGRSDEYTRWRTCLRCKAANSKKLLLAPPREKLAKSLLMVAVCFAKIPVKPPHEPATTRPPNSNRVLPRSMQCGPAQAHAETLIFTLIFTVQRIPLRLSC